MILFNVWIGIKLAAAALFLPGNPITNDREIHSDWLTFDMKRFIAVSVSQAKCSCGKSTDNGPNWLRDFHLEMHLYVRLHFHLTESIWLQLPDKLWRFGQLGWGNLKTKLLSLTEIIKSFTMFNNNFRLGSWSLHMKYQKIGGPTCWDSASQKLAYSC